MARPGCNAAAASFLLAGLCGCLAVRHDAPDELLRLAPQSEARYHCGPSTLASVLCYHGAAVPEVRIAEAIYSPTARGVLLTDLAWYAREQGFQAEAEQGTRQDLQQAIDLGRPPIVLLDLGLGPLRRPHFTALTGFGPRGVFFIGTSSEVDYAPDHLFERQWKRAGNQLLVIRPPSSAPP